MLKRSKEEVILLMLSGLSIPSILPFGIIRLVQRNWLLAAVDMAIVLGMMGIWVFVWRTRKVRFAGIAVTIFYSVGMLASIYVKGQPIVYWVYPTMIAAFFILKAREALFINTVSVLLLIVILSQQMALLDLSSVVVTLILINLFSYIFSHSTSLQHTELHHQADNDFLTGIGNRRAFDRKLAEICQTGNVQTSACLFLLDLDHFKSINDRLGHAVGDQVLVQFCHLIRSRIRAVDGFFRYGGEEFVLITVGSDMAAANNFAEELRALIERSVLIPDYQVTVSIGVAKLTEADSADTWVKRADAMLYEAKQSGRNTVRMAT
ncbi:MAG: GGDEF domain-containing protein [Undibacterium sp.]|nr:GGDEF domain-containing protein [Undibacterium sp.]